MSSAYPITITRLWARLKLEHTSAEYAKAASPIMAWQAEGKQNQFKLELQIIFRDNLCVPKLSGKRLSQNVVSLGGITKNFYNTGYSHNITSPE